ncbi:D-alanyl-D-alanine carboxypeptidase [Kiloniella laminariae]|uniref:serine-type D-Ala-D-Ala carboxypeptidase n=1 Tax=Kiloniella laminariae TaxID=454162 RepID=A0ABT4LLD9_9PROT|nr:D-alanyl-D-alanine carboxypeptidase family protein [Kiloniella laminariae]MCZ4281901.1 D-alanyl-D-alanine carboxypeptidase [Kiloniella laminariae]
MKNRTNFHKINFRRAMKSLLLGSACLLAAIQPGQAIDTLAREAYLVDYTTKTVLLDKNGDQSMPPASMSKIMTAYMVFERLKDGRLSLDNKLAVSEKAWRKGGSKMFVEVGNQVSIHDLLRGIIVQSGNDACIVVAEGLGGTEENFAAEMTTKGREIGLENSTFVNATGWPDPDQRMTAKDLATLADRIITDFPEYYDVYSEKSFTWAGITQGNRNPLLYKNIGSDGLKTGHTEEAGYGLTASAVQGDRRIILVVNGLSSLKERAEESERLVSWAFREFDNFNLFSAGEVVETADVWLGKEESIDLVPQEDLLLTLPRNAKNSMKATVSYLGPIQTPIEKGERLATLRIEAADIEPVEIPLVAANSVDRQGGFGRIMSALNYLIFGKS